MSGPSANSKPLESLFRTTDVIYVVKSPFYGDEWYGLQPAYGDGSGYVEAAFTDFASADQHRTRLKAEHRAQWLAKPYFSLIVITSFPPAILRDVVLELGLGPPPLSECEQDEVWKAWWEQIAPSTTDEQRAGFLDALNGIGHFLIHEVPLVG